MIPLLRTSRAGYTLVELLITVAVIGIAAAIVVPSFRATLARQELRSAVNDVFLALEHGRMESVQSHTGHVVAFEQPVDGTTYDLVLFRDTNFNCWFDNGTDPVLFQRDFPDTIAITENTFDEISKGGDTRRYLRWSTRGLPRPGIGVGTLSDCEPNDRANNGRIELEHVELSGSADDFVGRCITVDDMGRVLSPYSELDDADNDRVCFD